MLLQPEPKLRVPAQAVDAAVGRVAGVVVKVRVRVKVELLPVLKRRARPVSR